MGGALLLQDKLILVVDDQVGIRALISEVLGQQGYQVQTAASGVEALVWLGRCQPDLILLDMNMPSMSGLETLQGVRRIDSVVPVLMITADENDANMSVANQLGIAGRINKPFDLEELYHQVQIAIS